MGKNTASCVLLLQYNSNGRAGATITFTHPVSRKKRKGIEKKVVQLMVLRIWKDHSGFFIFSI